MKVQLAVIHELLHQTMRGLQEDGITEVEFNVDHYWEAPREDLYNPYVPPGTLSLGQISRDLESLRGAVRGEETLSPQHLVRFASILRVVGENAH